MKHIKKFESDSDPFFSHELRMKKGYKPKYRSGLIAVRFEEKFKLNDRVYYCPFGELGSNGVYIVVGIKKGRRNDQFIIAKNEKTELYKNKYFDQDMGFREKECWIESYKFISEEEYNAMKYNI